MKSRGSRPGLEGTSFNKAMLLLSALCSLLSALSLKTLSPGEHMRVDCDLDG